MRAPIAVTTWRSSLRLAPAVIVAALIATGSTVVTAPPAHALPPIPHPHPPPVRPPIHPLPHQAPEPGPAVDDIIPEPRPSNDPNEYDPPDMSVPPGIAPRGTLQPADDRDGGDGSTGSDASPDDALNHASGGGSRDTDTVPTGTSQYPSDGDNNNGGLDVKSLGLIGGVLMSLTSLVMWLRRRT